MKCRICHRRLIDPISLGLGIGPKCRQKYSSGPQQVEMFEMETTMASNNPLEEEQEDVIQWPLSKNEKALDDFKDLE